MDHHRSHSALGISSLKILLLTLLFSICWLNLNSAGSDTRLNFDVGKTEPSSPNDNNKGYERRDVPTFSRCSSTSSLHTLSSSAQNTGTYAIVAYL